MFVYVGTNLALFIFRLVYIVHTYYTLYNRLWWLNYLVIFIRLTFTFECENMIGNDLNVHCILCLSLRSMICVLACYVRCDALFRN